MTRQPRAETGDGYGTVGQQTDRKGWIQYTNTQPLAYWKKAILMYTLISVGFFLEKNLMKYDRQ
jgi:hypothetical protein